MGRCRVVTWAAARLPGRDHHLVARVHVRRLRLDDELHVRPLRVDGGVGLAHAQPARVRLVRLGRLEVVVPIVVVEGLLLLEVAHPVLVHLVSHGRPPPAVRAGVVRGHPRGRGDRVVRVGLRVHLQQRARHRRRRVRPLGGDRVARRAARRIPVRDDMFHTAQARRVEMVRPCSAQVLAQQLARPRQPAVGRVARGERAVRRVARLARARLRLPPVVPRAHRQDGRLLLHAPPPLVLRLRLLRLDARQVRHTARRRRRDGDGRREVGRLLHARARVHGRHLALGPRGLVQPADGLEVLRLRRRGGRVGGARRELEVV
jgi:hypothetical protein